MQIVSVGSAFPEHYYSQQEIAAVLKAEWDDTLPSLEVMERLHSRVGVDGRYLAVPIEQYRDMRRWGQANDLWIQVATDLGEKAITRAMSAAQLSLEQIGAMLTVSVTGIASPSLEARLINLMPALPADMRRTPIFGLGCVAGAAGLTQAADYVRAFPGRVAVLLSVELCSLTWQRNDTSVANLIASGLFGDGAAAVVVAGADVAVSAAQGPCILASQSSFYRDTQDTMGWNVSETGFTLVLSPKVPEVIRENLPRDVDRFLASRSLTRKDIGSYVFHTGGPKVLQAMMDALELPEGSCDASWQNLREVGNLSSTSVLLVLKDVMENRRPEPGTLGLIAAMGPGFCSELLLVEW